MGWWPIGRTGDGEIDTIMLLERDLALRTLAQALAQARAGEGRIVLVSGEAGIGKTALARRVAADGEDQARFLWGTCDPLLTPRALGPIHDIAREAGGELARALEAGASGEAVFAALLDELERPGTVLVVEDLHWADAASLDALVVVGRRIARTSGTLLLTYRSDELELHPEARAALSALPAEAVRRVPLAPLSPAAVAELAQRAGRSADGVHVATGGNPFYVTEVLAAAAPGVPASVREAIGRRVAALSPPARAVAELASIVPTRAELWLLREALGPEASALDECVAAGLLGVDGDAAAFRHELARAAVAEGLTPARRRALDRLALDALSTRPGIDRARLAHHARSAGEAVAILEHAEPAARAASAVGAHREAHAHAEAAQAAAAELGRERADLLELVADEARLCGRDERGFEALREALALHDAAGRRDRVGDCLRQLGRMHWVAGQGVPAERAGRRAIEVLEPLGPSARLGMAYSALSQLHMLAWRHDEAIELGERAIAVGRSVGDEETLVHALTNVGTAYLLSDADVQRGERMLEEAHARAVDARFHDHAQRALINLAYGAAMEGRAYAVSRVERAIAFAREHELESYRQYSLGMRAALRLLRGDWPGAEGDARAALDLGIYAGVSVTPSLVVLGTLQARRGEPEAGATLDDAWSRAQATGELQRLLPVAAARLEHAVLVGGEPPVDEARALYGQAADVGDAWSLGELAFRLWGAGAIDEAPPGIAEPYARAIAGDWRAAAALWDEIGRPYDAAEARGLADDDEPLLRALGELDRLGASHAAARLRRRLRERGVQGVPRGPRPATRALPGGLTPRQHEVLALMAAGATNAEIAERLVVSPKTVDHHVSAVLSKLDLGSRREAAAAARELGVAPAEGGGTAAPR
jgi:DNA-binding CsgD family transcriptional regulator